MSSIIQTAERSSHLDPSENVIFQRHLIAYIEASKLISGTVLEIGSGEGYGISELSKKAQKYIAIDKSDTPIHEELNKILERENRVNLYQNCLKFLKTRVDLDLALFKDDIWAH